jgi:hypothetical protein
MNPNFMGLIDSIKLRAAGKPELGRILTDKGYKKLALAKEQNTHKVK